MEQRKIVEERIVLNIPVNTNNMHQYKPGILWEELIKTKDVLDTDIITEIGYRKEKESGFGLMKKEDELEDLYIATLVIRKRPETDEEFLKRKQTDERYNIQKEEKDRLEFLRLKAKYEGF